MCVPIRHINRVPRVNLTILTIETKQLCELHQTMVPKRTMQPQPPIMSLHLPLFTQVLRDLYQVAYRLRHLFKQFERQIH